MAGFHAFVPSLSLLCGQVPHSARILGASLNVKLQVDTDQLAGLSSAVSALADSLAGNPYHQSVSLGNCGSNAVYEGANDSDAHYALRAIVLEADLRMCVTTIEAAITEYEAQEAAMAQQNAGGGGGGGGW